MADQAAAVIMPHFRSNLSVAHKGGSEFDPVTEADRGAEKAMRALLADRFPEHGIIGEEFGNEREDAEYCWVLDPIDGTRAFIMGQPLWGILIGLYRHGKPLLGMVDQPFTKERFWNLKDGARFRHAGAEQAIAVRPCKKLEDAIIATTTPDNFDVEELLQFDALSTMARLRRFGGDCYNYCLIALGEIDLVMEAGLKNYDIAALIPIIEAAGGVVTAWDGGSPANGGRILAAGDPAVHAEALKCLNP